MNYFPSQKHIFPPKNKKKKKKNSEDEDDSNAEFERTEAWSRIVTAIQFAAYMLHVLEPNGFLRWGFLFQVIFALKFYKVAFPVSFHAVMYNCMC